MHNNHEMKEIEFIRDYDITSLTTFGIPAKTKLFAEYKDWKELTRIARSDEYIENPVFHIGGGSNLLFKGYYNGLILHSGVKGINFYDPHDDADTIFVIAGAGEKWTDLVERCVEEGAAGLENLAGIPGEVGASPVQNVGAYGVEAGDFIHNIECFDRDTNRVVTIEGKDCHFGYRWSRFKGEWKDRYFVLRVSFRLRKSHDALNIEYGSLRNLEENLGRRPTIREVAEEVKRIRDSKLPSPEYLGSAGSFFKNPIIREGYYLHEVLNMDSRVPSYPAGVSDGRNYPGDVKRVKIPAGWLIEQCGLKGKRIGGAEIYPDNCLVIINRDNATSGDVEMLAEIVRRDVNRRFHIQLKPEVNYIDSDITVTVLGSGTSKGVPEVGCECDTCISSDPHDKRLRSSILVRTMGQSILIDATPDFRMQALRENIKDIDAVLITHTHNDHVGGIDDLRPYSAQGKIDIYCREEAEKDLRHHFDYCFSDVLYPGAPQLRLNRISDRPFFINGIEIIPIEVLHGKMPIFGYRIGKFAYITDAKYISEDEKEKLKGLEVLIINGLREREHFSHLTVSEALELIDELRPRRAYLTHLCHEVGRHAEFERRLPEKVSPLYDGEIIVVR